MKSIYLTGMLLLLSAAHTYAQNTFPTPSGAVGIGTTTPTALLDVKGDFKLGVDANKGGSAYSIALTRTDAQLYSLGAGGLNLGGDGTGTDLNITPGGNIGIGTAPGSAAARLHILNGMQQIQFATGTCSSGYTLSIGTNDDGVNFNNNSNWRGFNFSNLSGKLVTISNTGNVDIVGITKSLGPVTFIGPGAAAEPAGTSKRGLFVDNDISTAWDLFTLRNAAGVHMKVTGNGNVGIGTLNPNGYKLAVEGTIGGRRVKVTQESWADFVFHPGYQLPSLQETEKYIEQHQHLPGIPAEQTVKADGIDLGDMNKLLLQKIEEQMLYIIQLNKQVQQLTEKVQRLEEK